MKNLLLTTAVAFALTTPAFAAGTHGGGHDEVKTEEAHGHGDHAEEHVEMMIGKPGEAADVTRTIDVIMHETDDGEMLFAPTSLDIAKGETTDCVKPFAAGSPKLVEHPMKSWPSVVMSPCPWRKSIARPSGVVTWQTRHFRA